MFSHFRPVALCAALCLAALDITSLRAQPRATRSDIIIKQFGIVGHNAVRIRRDPASGNLYVLNNNGTVQRLIVTTPDTATLTTVYQTADHGLNAPLGMAFGQDGTMFLVGNDSSGQFGTATIVRGMPQTPGSEQRVWSVIAHTVAYPYGNIYNHRMSGIIVNRTGDSLYVNSGAATDHGEAHGGFRDAGLTSIILRLPTSGQNIELQNDRGWLRSDGYLMAEGIRNTFDFAYAGNGDLFGVENSDDRDDPDELNWIREGHHYGFPWRIGGNNTPQQFTPYNPHADPLLSPFAWGGGNLYATYSNDPGYPPRPDSVVFTEPIASTGPSADRFRDTLSGIAKDASSLGLTIGTFTPHRSPDGIVFDRDSLLGQDLKGGGFVISVSNGALVTALGDTSNDLLHVALTKAGDTYTAHVTRLVAGFNSPLGIELVGSTLYVLETGLEAPNSVPKLWKIQLPTGGPTAVSGRERTPEVFSLLQNYPNPFNPSTSIEFVLPNTGSVNLTVYNVLGQQVSTLFDGSASAGHHAVQWDGKDSQGKPAAGGVYFYRLTTGNHAPTTRAMLLVK